MSCFYILMLRSVDLIDIMGWEICYIFLHLYTGLGQSMKIDDRKINRSIDDNRLIIVN